MKDSKELKLIRLIMADLNYLWITFYSLFTIFTIHKICAAFRASEFLDRISGPALSPFQRLCLSLSAYTLIILLMSVEDLLFKDKHLSVVFFKPQSGSCFCSDVWDEQLLQQHFLYPVGGFFCQELQNRGESCGCGCTFDLIRTEQHYQSL